MIDSVLEFAKIILPVFQIFQAILIPVLFYQVLKVHKKRLELTMKNNKEE